MIMDHGDGARVVMVPVVMVPAKGGIGASADGASGGGASADGASADGAGDGDANADEHVDAVKNPPVKSALNQVSVRELAQTKARLVDE